MTNTMIARAAGDYVLNMTEQEITLIKNTACKGGTDEQLAHLIYMAKSTSLDPLKGQIRSIPRGAQRSVQIGIDGFRLIAERTGRYAPGKEATYEYDEDGALTRATAYIKKMTADGTWHEITGSVSWVEYGAVYSKQSPIWKEKPEIMLSKCAEMRALRRAFPDQLSGMYGDDEMPPSAEEKKAFTIETKGEESTGLVRQELPLKLDNKELQSLAHKVSETLMDDQNLVCAIMEEEMAEYLAFWQTKKPLKPQIDDLLVRDRKSLLNAFTMGQAKQAA